ncbi:MAG: SDR family oxidoreductase [Oscillospiraceae bacterium]|jgi:NAD(P)-dependent dehydrogenase (short-subunit alcohol dehydrogenase family)|nr:SDR family oxidoreductase [Oscillospiraceae bacterium]
MATFYHPNLRGRTAVVTGGGGVLCAGFCKVLAAQGVRTAVLDLNPDAAQATADAIAAQGGTAMAIACNVLEKPSLEAARAQVCEAFGPCDILINGAGGNHPSGTTSKETLELGDLDLNLDGAPQALTTFFDLDPQGISNVFNLNFLGTLLPTQVFARDLARQPHPVIVTITSMNALRPLTKIPAYSAAKAAVSNFTQFMAVHFAPVGIRVNAIAPGFFSTNQNKTLLWNPDGSPTPRSKKILAATPMGRFGLPEELAGALLFLCDEGYSSFVTGSMFAVDGGFSAYSGV